MSEYATSAASERFSDKKLEEMFEVATENAADVAEEIRSGGEVAGLMNCIFGMPTVVLMWRGANGQIEYRVAKCEQLLQGDIEDNATINGPMTCYRTDSLVDAETICGTYSSNIEARWVDICIGDKVVGARLTSSNLE